ncbi:hypothetical protein M703_07930 [Neisseria gonorrhoeae SK29344]|uniref:Uncharacterized protein n=1 Tax=Neisseria gonorrhoeae 3502 TaxID=1193404 RepID=A0AA44ZHW4_NEIGO|nr:hypothetical protein M717_13385 [Neisseria gonorrhoeae SK33414]KLR78381.1 hypothetical protein M680_02470 [Neisseria gonorrhoeae SK8976]KLR80928.1 hypothetical protein M679_09285 [Neisseria gonorrhoeae SK7842]KLR83088.1 hypothetical protein M675_00510 [Neisseria gonorrhoeae SK1902]KLR83628.1 hypothetical protein M684_00355 [Neisseria gonorrhoeae SK15454]KLR86416.1 hypothetical protein M677_05175 [Neisseria gonorrhoeae SK6987]KLR89345.1 hypothetical protein M702_01690 [Neisseria gonorrhoeae
MQYKNRLDPAHYENKANRNLPRNQKNLKEVL